MLRVLMLVALLIVLPAMALTAALAVAEWPPTGEFSQIRQATRQIFIGEREGSSCSGVMVAPKRMLTAAHCIPDGPEGDLSVNKRPVKVLAVDKERDVALLEVAAGCPCVGVPAEYVEVDEPVFVVGFPLNPNLQRQILTEGRAQGDAETASGPRLVMTAPVAPGNSGGGVFVRRNGQWHLVGIANAFAASPCDPFSPCLFFPHLSLAAPQAALLELLSKS